MRIWALGSHVNGVQCVHVGLGALLSGFHVTREEVPCFLKNLHPACRVIRGVEVKKRTDESAREHVRFGGRSLALLRFRAYLNVVFKDHALTDELGICPTRVIHALAGDARGREQNFGFSPCLLGQKAWRGG